MMNSGCSMTWRQTTARCTLAFLFHIQASLAVRTWDDGPEDPQNSTAEKQLKDCNTFGDSFQEGKAILWRLDFAWFCFTAALGVGILLWMPVGLRVDGIGLGVEDCEPKSMPSAWYKTAFQSLSSHAAGLVGFAGFIHLVVVKVLMVSDPCNPFQLSNCLLYVTLALSVAAVISSCVFLVVDYLRRLVIASARRKHIRLTLQSQQLEHTGLGQALMFLAGLMVLLFILQIIKEAEDIRTASTSMEFLFTCVGGCATVLLFYVNLRQMYQSPKVQFDSTCYPSEKDKPFAEFLKEQSAHGPLLQDWAEYCLRRFGGEDLALLANHGSRQVLFPRQQFAPLLHVLFGLFFIGLFPLGVQQVMEEVFVAPKLIDLKELMGDSVDFSETQAASIIWQWTGSFATERGQDRRFVLLSSSDPGSLQVTPEFGRTSSVRLCCDPDPEDPQNCRETPLDHSLTKFHNKPLNFVLDNVSNCTLSLVGLSRSAVTKASLTVVSKTKHHFGSCSNRTCKCSEGLAGQWDFHDLNDATVARLNTRICGRCLDGETGAPPNNCMPASCDVFNSNQEPGLKCSCADGFRGNITWNGSIPRGGCQPAKCALENSEGQGADCRCIPGFAGTVTWNGSQPTGYCAPAPCDVANSTKTPGLSCKCLDRYVGTISWNGSEPLGSCRPAECTGFKLNGERGPGCRCKDGFTGEPIMREDAMRDVNCSEAPCNIPNTTGNGLNCRCRDSFSGFIYWKNDTAFGSCSPARCDLKFANFSTPGSLCKCDDFYSEPPWDRIRWRGSVLKGKCMPMQCEGKHSNGVAGPDCGCMNGYHGTIRVETMSGGSYYENGWKFLQADCKPAVCNIPNSNRIAGPRCRCKDGFIGAVSWKGPIPNGTCEPAECSVNNSNMAPGPDCRCKTGYVGEIYWEGFRPKGFCKPLPCEGEHVNGVDGPGCRCADGFTGNPRVVGNCRPAPCDIVNSNFAPGKRCKCAHGYTGEITWKDSVAQGSCVPAPCYVPNSNFKAGWDCRCKDGFSGQISWDGAHPSGTCTGVPCSIGNSDSAAGPDCQCLPGFYGDIKWEGTQVRGECLQQPVCSTTIVHVAWLMEPLEDSEERMCEAGQQLIFYGKGCTFRRTRYWTQKIHWTSVESQPPGRCKWRLPRMPRNGCPSHDTDNPQVFSMVYPPLPDACSRTQAVPRCHKENFQYTIPSSNAARYNCAASAQNITSDFQLVRFVGHLCGYDLLEWKTAQIVQWRPELRQIALMQPCDIQKQIQQPSCGRVPDPPGENLPGVCSYMSEPAVLSVFKTSDVHSHTASHFDAQKMFGFIKFFQNGVCDVHGSDRRVGTFNNCWGTDRTYLWFQNIRKFASQGLQGENLFIREPSDLDGSEFEHYSEKFALRPKGALPNWWAASFRQVTDTRFKDALFKTDVVAGCALRHYQNGTCYAVDISISVLILNSTERQCMELKPHSSTGGGYSYISTQGASQIFAKEKPCLPFASRYELQLDIADVRSEGGNEGGDLRPIRVATMVTGCRTYLRLVVDMRRTACKSKFAEEWRELRGELFSS